jgi:hypothetical protein
VLTCLCINNLGQIKKYVIHYELQHHGSVHAHIILWVNENDLQRIKNEIITFIPIVFIKQIKNLFHQMIVYNLNYLKCYYKKNFMNIKIIILKKDIMKIVNLDFHILHTMKLIFLIKKIWKYFKP